MIIDTSNIATSKKNAVTKSLTAVLLLASLTAGNALADPDNGKANPAPQASHSGFFAQLINMLIINGGAEGQNPP
ncbi:MAG: hypothetical protein ACI8WB_005788 [Phenylobacterium sp.]|jgi:hypothetical protein